MSDRSYDQFGHRFFSPMLNAVVIDGTASALAAEASPGLIPIPFACKLVSASRINETGVTAAVALVSTVITKSVGGTGTVSAVGTFVYTGTCATGATGSAAIVATGTAAEFAAGDVIGLSEAIGTIASINTHSVVFGFEEMYN